ncbi:MAG: hypothetical protein SFX73_33840 [Kofleriaceae bacterium]|nr:hypothetical protein [Kofleriaceae bacterium]
MTSRVRLIAVAASLLSGGLAVAQPQPQPSPRGDKVDAKSLMQSGVRLLEAKDYLGALAVFKDAYARFPSAKILLNIGTTLNLLDRKAEAANTYQRYLDSPEADPARKADVSQALIDLDKSVGILEITVVPDGAEVQINDSEWLPAAQVRLYRVAQGPFTVRARKDKFAPEAKSASIVTGEKAGISISLAPAPETARINDTALLRVDDVDDTRVGARIEAQPRARLGGIAVGHVDVRRGGGAAFVGLTADVTSRLQVELSGIIGPNYGVFPGARFALLTGTVRPLIAAGMPIFFSDGARIGVRGAGGVELQVSRHLSLIGELGMEFMLNPETDKLDRAFIPALGATGRL